MKNKKEKTRQQLMEELEALRSEIEQIKRGDGLFGHPEEDFKEIRELFRSVTDNMLDAMVIIDWEGNILYANEAAFRLVGMSGRTDTAGLNIFQFLPPDTTQTVQQDLSLVSNGTEAFNAEYRINTLDGGERWVETLGKKISYLGKDADLVNIRDVTERRRTEEALRRRQAWLDSIFRAAPTGIGVVADRVILEANDHLCEMTGYSVEELKGKSARILYSTDEDYNFVGTEKYRQIRETGTGCVETRWRRKDGTVIDIILSSTPINLRDIASGVMLTALDITDRKLAEKALRESEQRYHSLFMNNHAVMLLIHPETGQIIDANPAACSFYGYSRNELMTKKITDINILSTEQTHKEMKKAQSRQTRYFLFKHRLASGEARDVEVYSGPIMVGGEDLLYSIIHDITDRRRAQEALKESEERFRTLVQNSSDVIVIIDEKGLFAYESSSVQRVLGYKKGYLLGKTPAYFTHPDDIEQVLNDLDEVFSGTNPGTPTEFRFRKADGTWIYLEAIGKNLLDYPGINGIVITARDITSRKKIEQERLEMERRLLHAQKLESLGVMAGGIAHDFNNLLMAILGNLDLALLDISAVSRSHTYIEHARSAGHKAADLTNQMLAYSGRGKFDLKAFDMSEIVEEMVHLLKTAITKTITLNLQMDRDLSPIMADPGQVQQIIMNLIVNASDAIDEKPGIITITTGMQECDEAYFIQSQLKNKPHPGLYVYLEVRDTGCGMDKQTKEKLFDPFFTTKFTGRGLGMAAVLGIVEGHKGSITVESEPGEGTTIRVLFPAIERVHPARREQESAAPTLLEDTGKTPLTNKTVLIVDDEDMVLSVCKSMVEHLGCRVVTATDGDEAIKVFHTHKDEIDCVILDLTMPKKDGQATFEELRRIRSDIKIIISSGYDEQEITQRFFGKRLSGIIKKPYQLENLAKVLTEVCKAQCG